MAKKNDTFHQQIDITETIIQVPLEDVMPQSIMPYAQHVIMERALPSVEDGLKPVQRRILYTMQELGLSPDKPHRKCARIVGDCLGKFHPHGDSSVYDALVRMAQSYSLSETLVDGHGNFGSIDGDSAAAMRYTEARMTPLAMHLLRDIQKDTVGFHLNFDDTLSEPDVLPARYPNLLVNGATGIAVGLATNIPPHNLSEVINATCLLIQNEQAPIEEIMEVLPAPDFPTGGELLQTPEIQKAYETGKGKLTLRAKITTEKGNAGRTLLVITQVPYMVSKANMLEKILKVSQEKKAQLGGIFDIRDESDREGMRAVIELRKDADVQKTLAFLYKYTDLQVTVGVNMFAIANNKPMQMGIRDILLHYIKHQKNVVTRRTEYDLSNAKARAHILEGLIRAVDALDEIIALIRNSKTPKEAKEKLCATFQFTKEQAQAILELRLQRLTGLEIVALRKEYKELMKCIKEYESILSNPKKLMEVITKELLEIKELFPSKRRTTFITPDNDEHKPEVLQVIESEPMIVTQNNVGQIKRISPKLFEKMTAEEKESEKFYKVLEVSSRDTLLFFTNIGNCYPLMVESLPLLKPKERGMMLTGILHGLEEGETCIHIHPVPKDGLQDTSAFLFITKNGLVKRTKAKEYEVKRTRFAALSLKQNDEVCQILEITTQKHLFLATKQGAGICFMLSQVPDMGRVSNGVIGIKLEENDCVIAANFLKENQFFCVITERGYGKRLPSALIDVQKRAGKGAKIIQFNKNGSTGTYLACVMAIDENDKSFLHVLQAGDKDTTFHVNEFPVASLQDKGKPMVLALFDEIVLTMAVYQ